MKTRIPKELPELDMEKQKQAIAYQLWEDEGRPEGKAEEHWAKACLVVMSLAEGETLPSPVWLKRHDEAIVEHPTVIDNLTKRSANRQAA
jgi:Protein of unknown function (DUF2934)